MAVIINIQDVSFTQEHEDAPYQTYAIEVRYVWDEGLLSIPVATAAGDRTAGALDARPASKVVRKAAPGGRKEVHFVAKRTGVPPQVPHPDSYRSSSNEVLAVTDVVVQAPALQHLGDLEWTMRGVYVYILKKPIWVEDGLDSATTPYDTTTAADNKYPATVFDRSLQ